MRNAFARAFCELATEDPRLILLVADIGAIVFDEFRARRPGQFINVGVSEANLVGVAAGLALAGARPFAYTIAPFVALRAYEQIRVDLCQQHLPVTVVGVGGGLAYSLLGPTHHAIEDLACMRALPGMTVVAPADPTATDAAVRALARHDGPAYLRLGTAGGTVIPAAGAGFTLGRAARLRDGGDGTLLACGEAVEIALAVAERMAALGRQFAVLDMATLKPLDVPAIMAALQRSRCLFTIEEHSIIGGLGSAVAEVIAERAATPVTFRRFGIRDRYTYCGGTRGQLREKEGLLPQQIAAEIQALPAG